jgi:hypothetical protein
MPKAPSRLRKKVEQVYLLSDQLQVQSQALAARPSCHHRRDSPCYSSDAWQAVWTLIQMVGIGKARRFMNGAVVGQRV